MTGSHAHNDTGTGSSADGPVPGLAEELQQSDQDTAGSMGVSSERVGPTGPGQVGTTGTRDVSPRRDQPSSPLPEQSRGGPEANPRPVSVKAPPHSYNRKIAEREAGGKKGLLARLKPGRKG
ncbi:hypothetical protein [Nocardioides litoris]|uniref:hypothetical protein n=1 Tax=Nocardioides litoris TaxID=1926648 RepID=UPI00111CF5DE|nr:hypothetical protein [Nocardioides litoris]